MLTTVDTHDNINELRVKHKRVSARTVPWQINSNATLKILWEISVSEENTSKNYNLDKSNISEEIFVQKRCFWC